MPTKTRTIHLVYSKDFEGYDVFLVETSENTSPVVTRFGFDGARTTFDILSECAEERFEMVLMTNDKFKAMFGHNTGQ